MCFHQSVHWNDPTSLFLPLPTSLHHQPPSFFFVGSMQQKSTFKKADKKALSKGTSEQRGYCTTQKLDGLLNLLLPCCYLVSSNSLFAPNGNPRSRKGCKPNWLLVPVLPTAFGKWLRWLSCCRLCFSSCPRLVVPALAGQRVGLHRRRPKRTIQMLVITHVLETNCLVLGQRRLSLSTQTCPNAGKKFRLFNLRNRTCQ